MLPSPSLQQKAVIDRFRDGNNVVVDSVAGAGKTTMFLHLARETARGHLCLVLTYNSHLRRETRVRVRAIGIDDRLHVHTYHSLCLTTYAVSGYRDNIIQTALNEDLTPERYGVATCVHDRYQVLFLDEQQDATTLYYRFTRKVLRDLCTPDCQIVTCGDHRQNIYEYQGTDARFLTLSPVLYPDNGRQWQRCELNESRRVSESTALFVDVCLLGGKGRFVSIKPNHPAQKKPWYVICNMYSAQSVKRLCTQLCKLIKRHAYTADDIMILAPSINSANSVAKRLEHAMIGHGIPCFVPVSDECKLDDRVTHKKAVFSTYHQAKGRERKIAVVLCFDDSYTTYYNKTWRTQDGTAPNPMYVACTRGSEVLVVVHHRSRKRLPFLPAAKIVKRYVELHVWDEITDPSPPSSNKTSSVSVTRLIAHLSEETTEKIVSGFEWKDLPSVHEDEYEFDVPSKHSSTVSHGAREDVSDINGNIVTLLANMEASGPDDCVTSLMISRVLKFSRSVQAMYRASHPHAVAALEEALERHMKCTTIKPSIFLRQLGADEGDDNAVVDRTSFRLQDLACVATAYNSYTSDYHSRLLQLDGFEWWTIEDMLKVLEIMEYMQVVNPETLFEPLVHHIVEGRTIAGYIDIIAAMTPSTARIVYEIKFTASLEPVHHLQLLLYAYLDMMMMVMMDEGKEENREELEDHTRYMLVNVKSGQRRELIVGRTGLHRREFIEDMECVIRMLIQKRVEQQTDGEDGEDGGDGEDTKRKTKDTPPPHSIAVSPRESDEDFIRRVRDC